MNEEKKIDNLIRAVALGYLILFCALRIIALTNLFDNSVINTIFFVIGWLIVAIIFIKKKGKFKYPKELKIFILIIFVNMFFNFEEQTIKSNIFEIFYIFTIFIISSEYITKKELIKISKIMLVLTFIIVLFFYIKYVFRFIYGGVINKGSIAHLVFSNVNGGAILALINIVTLYYLKKEKIIGNKFFVFLDIYYILFIIISEARTSIMVLGVILLYSLFHNLLKDSKYTKIKYIVKKIIVFCIVGVVMGMSVFIVINNYKEDRSNYEIEKRISKATTLRYWLWKSSIKELIETNILFGVKENFGEESFKNMEEIAASESLSSSQIEVLSRSNVHNGYIQILVRNGILGLLTICIFFRKLIKKVNEDNRNSNYNLYTKYFYLVYFFINFFENNIVLSNTFFVLLLWIHVGVDYKIYKKGFNKVEKDEGIF